MNGGPQARVSSPVLERSTLMTSAPRSASTCPAQGPARMRASSKTRTPANGPGMGSFLCEQGRDSGAEWRVVWPENAVLSIADTARHWRGNDERRHSKIIRHGARYPVPQGAQD